MARLLLTLLALLTGLAATGTPAAARLRMGDGAEIGAVAALVQGTTQAVQTPRVLLATAQPDGRFQQNVDWTATVTAPAIPAFLPGIDRAHE
jgi:hypothetical protein